jgi:arsenite-transporting ATPase
MTWYMPEFMDEMVGLAAFSQMATNCFAQTDPGTLFTRGSVQEVVPAANGKYFLQIPMPYMTAGEVRLRQKGNELFITMGNFKREIILPSPLAQRTATHAQRAEGVLTIVFEPKKGAP